MKFGCSLKLLFIVVIVAAAFYYLFSTEGRRIISSTEEKIKNEIVNRMVDNLSLEISNTVEDSVKIQLDGITDWLKKNGRKLKLPELKKISDHLGDLVKKKIIDSKTLKEIQKEIDDYEKLQED